MHSSPPHSSSSSPTHSSSRNALQPHHQGRSQSSSASSVYSHLTEKESHAGSRRGNNDEAGSPWVTPQNTKMMMALLAEALLVSALVLMTSEVRMDQSVRFPTQKALAVRARNPAAKARCQEVGVTVAVVPKSLRKKPPRPNQMEYHLRLPQSQTPMPHRPY